MAQSHTGEVLLQMPPITVEHTTHTGIRLHSCFSSGLASVISTICIGLFLGGAGGLLAGGTAVVLLQSLEVLAENKLLMDKLADYASIRDGDDYVRDAHISIFAEEFGVICATLSAAVGVASGLATYARVIKEDSEAATGKALGLAGPVCLMSVTATGYVLGQTLEVFLSVSSTIYIGVYLLLISYVVFPLHSCICVYCFESDRSHLWPFVSWLSTPIGACIAFGISFLLRSRLILMVTLTPTVMVSSVFGEKDDFQLTIVPVPFMLIIIDVFAIAGKPIIVSQPPASPNTSSVLENIFIGVLTSQLFMAAIGMSLFVSWQKGAAGKICASAAVSGTAVLGAIKLALPALGPGPTIGTLMGVAGAVGVSLSAAGAKADHYGRVGRFGVTLGAAVGAFLASCAHSGLSGILVGLCAAVIPGGPYLQLLFGFLRRLPEWYRFKFCLSIVIPIILLIWIYFTYTHLFLMLILLTSVNFFSITFVQLCFITIYHMICKRSGMKVNR